MVDCAHAGLTHIPKSLPIDTDWLIFPGNNISSLGIVDLQFLHYISRLDLSNNKIKHISADFIEYLRTNSNVVNLDISNNELKFIPRNFESVNFLKKLRISGNKFACKCNNMWMKNWIKDNTETIQDYNVVNCQMEFGKSIPFVKLSDADLICASMFITFKMKISIQTLILYCMHLSDTHSVRFLFFQMNLPVVIRCYADVTQMSSRGH